MLMSLEEGMQAEEDWSWLGLWLGQLLIFTFHALIGIWVGGRRSI